MTDKQRFEELDEWLFVGIGDDILHRPEYQDLIQVAKDLKRRDEEIPAFVCGVLFERSRKKSLIEKVKELFR